MNFSQLQERVRLELLRRIERGTASVSLLARQTGLGQAHISNFLHGRRQLSLGTLDKLLAAQRLTVEDLMPVRREALGALLPGQMGDVGRVPLVSAAAAMFEPFLRPSIVQSMVALPAEALSGLLVRCSAARRQWERFVAVRISAEDAKPMEPAVTADALVVLDRHYNSFRPYREGAMNLYGVRVESRQGPRLLVRYAEFQAGRVVLRPEGRGFPLEVLEVGSAEAANELLVGRVAVVVNG